MTGKGDIVRVLRVLEYVGERQWIETTLRQGSVPANGERAFTVDGVECSIRSATIGQFPDLYDAGVLRQSKSNFDQILTDPTGEPV